ncbi:unnamed protein product [Penicillium salamii]|uniref:Uncharacterized protein n=1 Tax=Penicillium salamii TaxID=1612424 RepID=A0A9W4MY51_9EURO|nr:unnamed protein product [Penicillium salamii]CAG8079592.1 unnamed protein product [Penicillium salamii]CAG8223043.1 unnamed protein product [Penicillium salamii]CAG8271020.1 unnamed protein product [Penicillium salamii]CAG8374528.1 unnamed protein product [Penicillium salamii]
MAVLTELLNGPFVVQGASVALLVVLVTFIWDDIVDEIPHRRIPLVGRTWGDITNKKARSRFVQSSRALIAEGFAKVGLQIEGLSFGVTQGNRWDADRS